MTVAPLREKTLRRLDGEVFDVLVVGGGATGAGIARDATLRGLGVALVEAGDFAGETSSHSSKLIHGGLRYLQYGDLGLVFEALSERRRLMATAPHLCRPIEFLFPAYRGLAPRLNTLGAGIALYNALALWRPPVSGRRLTTAEVLSLSPLLRSAGLQGAQLYADCQTDDARLVLETVLDTAAAGAVVASRVIVTELLRDRRGHAYAAAARDRLAGTEITIQARAIVNATGPFSDAFDRGRQNLRPTLGVHLVLDAARLPHAGRATVMRSPRDGRLVFLLPAGARTIIGTTDPDWHPPAGGAPRSPRPGDLIAARATDVSYLLEVANAAFPPVALGPDDVVSTYAGLRPLVAASAHTASQTSREHELLLERDGLLTIVGGKLTTYRRMAEQTVDKLIEVLRDRGYEGALAPCTTAHRALPGGKIAPDAVSLGDVELAPDVERHLRLAYGSRAPAVLDCTKEQTVGLPGSPTGSTAAHVPDGHPAPWVNLAARIDGDLPYLWGEVLHAARHELATEVEDVLRRRIPIFRDARDQGLAAAPGVAAILGLVLGWSAERRAQSVRGYADVVASSRAWTRATAAHHLGS
jgi:glycerol-3-phosphate dehydrogenase